MKPMTYVIEGKDGIYKLAGDSNIEYPSIWRLITNNKMSLNFLECIFPSDIGKYVSVLSRISNYFFKLSFNYYLLFIFCLI